MPGVAASSTGPSPSMPTRFFLDSSLGKTRERLALESLDMGEEEERGEESEVPLFLERRGILKPLFELAGLDDPALTGSGEESDGNCTER